MRERERVVSEYLFYFLKLLIKATKKKRTTEKIKQMSILIQK